MAANLGPKIIRSGLVLNLDAGDKTSYSGSGTNWKDLIGNYDGTLTNSPVFNSANGGSIVFDGTDDYVLKSSLSNFNVGCIDIWLRPSSIINAASGGSTLLQLKNAATTNNFWYVGLGGITGLLTNEYITIVDGGSNRLGVTDAGSLAANTWVNLVINWESSAYKIYINNIVKTTSSAGTIAQLTVPSLYILGAYRDTTSSAYSGFFTGRVGILKIYNRTLSATEMLQNYVTTKSRFGL
jgi:hypothetical protein